MVDFGKTIPCWEVSSRSFLPLSAKGLRIEGSQGLPSRWVLLSVPCGELRIGRIQVNQSQQVLPWLAELALLSCTHLRQAKPPCPAVPPASYLWPGEGRETEAWKRNQKHPPSLEQGTFLCSHGITHPWQLPLPVPGLAVLTLLGSRQELHSLHSFPSFPRSCCLPRLAPGAPSTPWALRCGHGMGQNTSHGTQIPSPDAHSCLCLQRAAPGSWQCTGSGRVSGLG